jgi:hypothetical protein
LALDLLALSARPEARADIPPIFRVVAGSFAYSQMSAKRNRAAAVPGERRIFTSAVAADPTIPCQDMKGSQGASLCEKSARLRSRPIPPWVNLL